MYFSEQLNLRNIFKSWHLKVSSELYILEQNNMKIDLFRNKEIPEGKNPYEKEINSIEVYDYIDSHIEFNLTRETWMCIDNIFSEIWNSRIGLGGSFYWNEIEDEVLFEFKKHRILMPDHYVKTIVHLILDYIQKIGGILE